MSEKERLNLTVRGDFKQKAARLATARRRSISALFEDLIDQELERGARSIEHHGKYITKKKSSG